MERQGYSLVDRVQLVVKQREGRNGPRVSEKVVWLADYIETENFWVDLNKHIAEDSRTRYSVGGVFYRGYALKKLGPFSWYEVFTSLDHFLKSDGMRAAEFLFRDFTPKVEDVRMRRIIEATRGLAFQKYPRIRRLYWDDYKAVFETPTFWRLLSEDLTRLREPIAAWRFFDTHRAGLEVDVNGERRSSFAMDELGSLQLRAGRFGVVRNLYYGSMTQMIEEATKKDARSFLLEYAPMGEDEYLKRVMLEAQNLLKDKVLAAKPKPSDRPKVSRRQAEGLIAQEVFWSQLAEDIRDQIRSSNRTASLGNFLVRYNRRVKGFSGAGDYERLVMAFSRGGKVDASAKVADKVVDNLMWHFIPPEELKEKVRQVRELCAEAFPYDCLYVVLQTPKFWNSLFKELEGKPKKRGFINFLRLPNPAGAKSPDYINEDKRNKLYRYAYLHKDTFMKFIRSLGVSGVGDYKGGLARLFLSYCPEDLKERLIDAFPDQYSHEFVANQLESQEELKLAKEILIEAHSREDKCVEVKVQGSEGVFSLRRKLVSAARTLGLRYRTYVDEDVVVVIGEARGRLN